MKTNNMRQLVYKFFSFALLTSFFLFGVSCSNDKTNPAIDSVLKDSVVSEATVKIPEAKKTVFEFLNGGERQLLNVSWLNDTSIQAEIKNFIGVDSSTISSTLTDHHSHEDFETYDDENNEAHPVREFVFSNDKSGIYYDIKIAFDTSFAVVMAMDGAPASAKVAKDKIMHLKTRR
ncbi:hypothetical protein BH09BAC5_BH09BAC5_22650 [soil metagenome]